MMEKDYLWVLLGKQLSGEISEKERIELQQLIRENEDGLSYLIEFLEGCWKKKSSGAKEREAALNEKWDRLSERIFNDRVPEGYENEARTGHERPGKKKRLFWYKAAAAMLLIAGVSYYFFMQHSLPHYSVQRYVIVAGGGLKKHIVMPDGTGIWLNADSRLSYDNEFADKNREVWLEGEAFFEVENDAAAPFTVHAQGITIKVLGTKFNVQAYKNEPDIQTTLISGKVQVSINNDPGKKIILSPREKLTVMRDKDSLQSDIYASVKKRIKSEPLNQPEANRLKYQVQTVPVNPQDSSFFAETAWLNDKLAFVYEPFSEVAKEMERRYNVHIVFRDNKLKKVIMSGVFDRETVEQALQVLQMITPFRYQKTEDSIYLYDK